jgi:uncharacterized membrane protein
MIDTTENLIAGIIVTILCLLVVLFIFKKPKTSGQDVSMGLLKEVEYNKDSHVTHEYKASVHQHFDLSN